MHLQAASQLRSHQEQVPSSNGNWPSRTDSGLWLEGYRDETLQSKSGSEAAVLIHRSGESSRPKQPKQRKRKRKPSPQSPHSTPGHQLKRSVPNAPALSLPPSAAHHPLLPVRFFFQEMFSLAVSAGLRSSSRLQVPPSEPPALHDPNMFRSGNPPPPEVGPAQKAPQLYYHQPPEVCSSSSRFSTQQGSPN
jgi:hypothetical protein